MANVIDIVDDRIKEGKWNEKREALLTRLFDIFKEIHKDKKWIKETRQQSFLWERKRDEIVDAIEKNDVWTTKSTKSKVYRLIALWFKTFHKQNKSEIEYYSKIADRLNLEIREQESENKLDEQEEKWFATHQTLLEVLKYLKLTVNENTSGSDYAIRNKMNQYLLLALLVLQPPLRTDFYTTFPIIKQNNCFLHRT